MNYFAQYLRLLSQKLFLVTDLFFILRILYLIFIIRLARLHSRSFQHDILQDFANISLSLSLFRLDRDDLEKKFLTQ